MELILFETVIPTQQLPPLPACIVNPPQIPLTNYNQHITINGIC